MNCSQCSKEAVHLRSCKGREGPSLRNKIITFEVPASTVYFVIIMVLVLATPLLNVFWTGAKVEYATLKGSESLPDHVYRVTGHMIEPSSLGLPDTVTVDNHLYDVVLTKRPGKWSNRNAHPYRRPMYEVKLHPDIPQRCEHGECFFVSTVV